MKLDVCYPVDWRGLEDFRYDFDDDGIPRVDYGRRLGLRYNPITTAQWGLFNLQRWKSRRDHAALEQALRCADRLACDCEPWKNDILGWIYDYGFDLYGPFPPWISAMAQGEAVSLLLRCHQLRPSRDYLDVCRGAVRAFFYDYEQGGVTAALSDGTPFFQEYPVHPPVHVLNGGLFALIGLYDYAAFFGDADAMSLAHRVVAGLDHHWMDWDLGYWTRYDLYRVVRPASAAYQELHARLFEAVGALFDDSILLNVAKRWRRQLKNPFFRGLQLAAKVREKALLAMERR